ncbi:MAG: hypothetical protein GY868_16280 [Deltaproteobacteria bacterium]|nr:hypothetical protein [Deltaproteobacteria bacterium]
MEPENPFTDNHSARFAVDIRSGARLSAEESRAVATLLSAAYKRGEAHADSREINLPDTGIEAFLRLQQEPGREVLTIREQGDLVAVLVTAAPKGSPYEPLRKLSCLAFVVKDQRENKLEWLAAAIRAAFEKFQETGLSIVAVTDAATRSRQELYRLAGLRQVSDQSEICWLLSNVFGHSVTSISGAGEHCHLSYVADFNGRKVELQRALFCADGEGGSAFQRHKAMVVRQMQLQHSPQDLKRFTRMTHDWSDTGLLFLLDFAETVTLGPGDGQPDVWSAGGLGINIATGPDDIIDYNSGRIYLPARRVDDLQTVARQQVIRPGWSDFLLWALRLISPVILLSPDLRVRVATVLDQPVADLRGIKQAELIEQVYALDHEVLEGENRTTADGTLRTAWQIATPYAPQPGIRQLVDMGKMFNAAFEMHNVTERTPLVYMGATTPSVAMARRILSRAEQGTPVILFAFGRDLESYLDRIFKDPATRKLPVLAFRATSFYESIMVLEQLGFKPSQLVSELR